MSPIQSRRFNHRSVRVFLLGCWAACLAGCGQPNLLWHGIGDSPYVAGETEKRLEAATVYLNTMCERAGLPTVARPGGGRQCLSDIDDQRARELTILAALNDIDERCGAYLTLIDEARRDQAFYNRKLSGVVATSNIILPLTNPGKIPLDVVRLIFGYAQGSLEKYYSRLILETEKGPVERIVTRMQSAYRKKLEAKLDDLRHSRNERLDGVSGAYYAVRGYLRLCLPETIESEIGSLVESVKYEDASRSAVPKDNIAVLASIDAIPTIKRGSGGTRPPPDQPTEPTRPPEVSQQDLATLRANLCLTSVPRVQGAKRVSRALSTDDPDYKWALEEFRKGRVFGQGQNVTVPAEQRRIIIASAPCGRTEFVSPYEKFAFVTPDKIKDLHLALSKGLNVHAPGTPLNAGSEKFTPETRDAIGILREKLKLPALPHLQNTKHIDSALHARLFQFGGR
jgi:hypothetical protein